MGVYVGELYTISPDFIFVFTFILEETDLFINSITNLLHKYTKSMDGWIKHVPVVAEFSHFHILFWNALTLPILGLV